MSDNDFIIIDEEKETPVTTTVSGNAGNRDGLEKVNL